MGSILEAFANQDLLTEPRFHDNNPAYGNAMRKLVDAEEALMGRLDPTGKKLLEAFEAAQCDVDDQVATDRFVYGYRLGVLMMVEVFTQRDELIAEAGI